MLIIMWYCGLWPFAQELKDAAIAARTEMQASQELMIEQYGAPGTRNKPQNPKFFRKVKKAQNPRKVSQGVTNRASTPEVTQ